MATLLERVIGAARLDAAIYEEIEADEGAFGQAMAVVVVSALAAGIGAAGAGRGAGPGLIGQTLASLIGWFAWAFVVYLVGTKLLPTPETKADFGQLLRTTGFSAAPGVVAILGVVPVVGGIAALVASLWQLAAMVIAVRQALDYTSTGRAIAVCAIGFVIDMLIVFVLVGALMSLLVGASHPTASP
jgi:hypothetical protein